MTTPYAVNLNLVDQPVLVVGGGPVAARKAGGLLKAGARVTVVAPDAISDISEDPDITWFERPYQRGEVASYRLAITATGVPDIDSQVAADARSAGVFVNSADDPTNCSFTLPAVARRRDLQIAISTNGRSPALARWLRRRLEREIATGYDQLLDLLAEVRAEVRRVHGTSEHHGWDAALDDKLLDLVRRGRVEHARLILHRQLGLDTTAVVSAAEVAS